MKKECIRLGKLFKEQLDKGVKFHANITLEHPYIKNYLDTLPKEEELKPKKKGKKVK